MNTTSSTIRNERADILDVLRGFAVLGIFMANSASFSLYSFMDDSTKKTLPTHTTDHWLEYFSTAFVEGKFYSLFSLLFGIGFTIILDRNQKAGRNPLVIFYKRIMILALIGLGHTFLLWEGDILFLYAIIGMALPAFRKLTSKTILILAGILLMSPLLFDLAKVLSDGLYDLSKPLANLAQKIDASNGITDDNWKTYLVDNNSYQTILNWCHGGFFWRWEYITGSNRIPKVLAMFLVGFVVGRKMIYVNLEIHKPLFQTFQKWGFFIGIPGSIAFAYFMHDGIFLPKPFGLTDTLFYAISVVPLSLAYTTSICLLWLNPKWQIILKYFAPVGRMALTNYILQTVAGVFIYYGIGLGLGAKTGPSIFLPIAIGVYCIQVAYSNFWFRFFNFGPLEWIWRQLTLGKRLKLVREN